VICRLIDRYITLYSHDGVEHLLLDGASQQDTCTKESIKIRYLVKRVNKQYILIVFVSVLLLVIVIYRGYVIVYQVRMTSPLRVLPIRTSGVVDILYVIKLQHPTTAKESTPIIG
jgi:hypothetical protein